MAEELILNELKKVQDKEGFLSETSLSKLAKESNISLAELYEAASFYSFFELEKRGKYHIKVCEGPACYMKGSENILRITKKLTSLKPGQHNKKFSLDLTPCIGCCNKPPAMMINDKVYTELDEKKVKEILKNLK